MFCNYKNYFYVFMKMYEPTTNIICFFLQKCLVFFFWNRIVGKFEINNIDNFWNKLISNIRNAEGMKNPPYLMKGISK